MLSACDLIAFTNTRGPGGTTVRTPAVLATVKCRLTIAGSALPIVAAQPTPAGDFVLFLPYGTDTSAAERYVVRGPDGAAPDWTIELTDAGLDEPRTYAASHRVRVKRADTVEV